MRRSFLSAVLAALTAVCAPAQDILGYDYHIDDWPNGLRLITVPTEFPDIVSVHIVVATGSRNEVEVGKSGFAHFFEHMMFRGSKNYTSAEQAAIFKQAGADRNAYTTDDFTNYHTTVTKTDLDTVLRLEADRFRYLQYEQKPFRTEAMAVFGEYNKNSANPINKAFEVLRDTAFAEHTYKHTTMGFLRDIRAMPRQYEYSREFFDRWYRPEYTTILVVGDTTQERTRSLVERYWGDWERGGYEVEIPVEPPQAGPAYCHIKWPAPTNPWLWIAHKGPAFDVTSIEMPALDVLSAIYFSSSSALYRKLYIDERKVDQMFGYFPDHADPFLLMVGARVRDPGDWSYVRDEILATLEAAKVAEIDPERLAAVKSNLRYGFANGLDSSEAIASALAGYIARGRTPEIVNQVYRSYERVTADDIRRVAAKFFVEDSRTIATLSHEDLPSEDSEVVAASVAESSGLSGMLGLPSNSSLVSVRLHVMVGAAQDPPGKEGLANLTAQLLTNGGTQQRNYVELIDAFFPMAAGVGVRVDKETTVFTGSVHGEKLDEFYALFREILRQPGFDAADFERVKSDVLTSIELGLRQTDDEELGKEVLYAELFAGHPYGHPTLGTIEGLRSITLEDVRAFYSGEYANAKITVGLAGGFSTAFARRIHADFVGDAEDVSAKPATARKLVGSPAKIAESRMTIVQKSARATGLHIGFPIDVKRGHPDWVALWLARSYLGEHRSENSYLYQRLREIRGLNYGDYAYIEHFPNSGSQFHPPTNVARSQQVFQIWIRPVPPENGPFTLKAAHFELEKLVRDGLSQAAFEGTREYLSKFVSLLVKTEDRQLGYALDAEFYGIGPFVEYVRDGLAKLTLDEVNRAIRTHLRSSRLQFVVVTEDAEGFRNAILGDAPTPITYQAEPPEDVLAEDTIIEQRGLGLNAAAVTIVPVEEVFAR